MKNVKLLLIGVLVTTGLVLSPSLYAQTSTSGIYAGVGIGQAEARDACNDLPVGFSCDDKDTSWRIFGGYQFHKHFAAELGYADFGKFTANATAPGASASAEVKAKAWDLVLVGILPAGSFSVFAKAGIARWDVDSSATVSLTGFGTQSGSLSDNGTDFTFGVGAQFNFTKNIGARVEWQRYTDVGDSNTTGQSDVDVLSASVLFMF